MIRGLFGPTSVTSQLRGGLEEASATHRAIAERIARAGQTSSNTDFADTVDAKAAEQAREEDLQRDMGALADTQLRYETDATLLKAAYGRLRAAIQDRV